MANTLRLDQDYPRIERSMELYNTAQKLIPGATQTLAKGVQQHSFGAMPIFVERGSGSHVWDVDGNEYLDFTMAVGPLSLGYTYVPVDDAVRAQLDKGITFSLPHPLEIEVASLLNQCIPNAEMIRFSKTGADVCSAAIRLARAATGRTTVLCCGYHGWHDWYIATTDRDAGIPAVVKEQTYTFQYNDIASVEQAMTDDVAAVILEPMTFAEPRDNFLHQLRDLCTQRGVVLIFDEMWTGFRLALGGAQEFFGVKADLACFSKAISNGMPLSVLTGRRELMQHLDKDVFFYTTFGGEALSLAAAKAAITEMREKNVFKVIESRGRILKEGITDLCIQLDLPSIECIGMPCRSMLSFSSPKALEMKSFVQQELAKRGILWNGFHTMSYSHTLEDIDYALAAYHSVLTKLRRAEQDGTLEESLRGNVLQPVFRRTTNFNTRPRSV